MLDTLRQKGLQDPAAPGNGLETWHALLDRTRPGRRASSTPMTDQLLALARRNRVLPALAGSLSPDDHSQAAIRLRAAATRQGFSALRLSSRVLQIARALDDAQTPGVFFKGAPLAQTLYGEVAARHPGDIDVIVDAQHARRAAAALVETGYAPHNCTLALMDDSLTEFMLKRHNHVILNQPDDGMHVELHWRPSVRPWLSTDLTTRAGFVPLSGGDRVRVPDPVDHALHLCVHGAVHLWSRLKWFQDMRVLFHDGVWIDGDWAALAQRARETGLAPAVGSTALLVLWADGCPPPAPLKAIAARPDIERLARTLWHQMCRHAGNEAAGGPQSLSGLTGLLTSEHIWGRLSDRPGRWRRALALNTLFQASLADVQAVPALKRMPWLTPFVRPLLEIGRRPRNVR